MDQELEKTYKIQNVAEFSLADSPEALNWLFTAPEAIEAIKKAQEHYLPWQEFRNKDWVHGNKEQVFSFIRFQRRLSNAPTPVKDKSGKFYGLNARSHPQFLHEVDLELGGNFMGIADFGEGDRRQFIRRNLIEESISSSKLEGANTSRDAARRMLTEGRKPRDKDERMIVNNHAVMTKIEESLKNEKLSIDLIKEIHREVTNGTLSNLQHEGELRNTLDEKGNRLKVMPWDQSTIAYVAPDRDFVEEQLPELIKFANEESGGIFIHPLIKAIILHFWIGLLHPFEDGNGRLARILFYWFMLRKGYWAFSYLSLSEKIIKSPRQYAMAYIYAEQDGFDLNYFVQYNVEKLRLARLQFQTFIKEKIIENRQSIRIIQAGYNLNHRQLKLLQYLAKDEERFTNMSSYHGENDSIGYLTAISDLKKLVEEGFLSKNRVGRNVFYHPTPKVRTLIK
jgi:Fic family protein